MEFLSNMKTLKRTREEESKPQDEPKSRRRQTKLTQYIAHPVTYYQRSDCADIPESWMPPFLKQIPNFHPKYPDVKARTPNLAIDNLTLFKNEKNELCTILGFFDKEVKRGEKMKGWVLSGGHIEYHQDVDSIQCALRELEEEFNIRREDIVKTVPVAVIDDAFRDSRNRYVTTVFLHWINAVPAPSTEHKVLKIVPVKTLKDMIATGEKLSIDENSKEKFGFCHGHDGILNVLFQDPQVQSICKEIMSSQ